MKLNGNKINMTDCNEIKMLRKLNLSCGEANFIGN